MFKTRDPDLGDLVAIALPVLEVGVIRHMSLSCLSCEERQGHAGKTGKLYMERTQRVNSEAQEASGWRQRGSICFVLLIHSFYSKVIRGLITLNLQKGIKGLKACEEPDLASHVT